NALFDNDALDVPVEAGGGPGTALGHWRETDFDVEQMTGYAAAGGVFMPISRVSVGALEDMGYNVNYDAADGYDPKTQTGTAWQPTNVGVRPYSYRVTVTSTQENLNLDFGTRGNTAPQLRNFNITPTPPETDSVITISTRAVDAEGDAIAAVTFYRETNGVTGLQSDDQYIVQRTKARRGLFTALVATNGLKPGEQTFYVVASDSLGASRRRTGAVTLVAPVPPPARPRELIVKAPGSDTAVLSWNAPSDNNARYRVEVSTSFTFARETIVQTFNTKPNATTATVKGLDASTIYYYRVRAFNSGGTSSYSAPANLRQPVFGEIVVDNLSSRFSTKGNWTAATSPTSYGPNYSTATSSGVGDVTSASFGLRLEKAQRYMLYIWWPAALENGGAVDVSVKTGDQKFVTTVDQSQRGGGWVLLDIFNFAAGRGSVTLSSATGGSIAADAIRLLPAG
ncbi:MAG TPA: fibronectin type III domain-containing protein, partial [Tepidisphaeraceae bacterium]